MPGIRFSAAPALAQSVPVLDEGSPARDSMVCNILAPLPELDTSEEVAITIRVGASCLSGFDLMPRLITYHRTSVAAAFTFPPPAFGQGFS